MILVPSIEFMGRFAFTEQTFMELTVPMIKKFYKHKDNYFLFFLEEIETLVDYEKLRTQSRNRVAENKDTLFQLVLQTSD